MKINKGDLLSYTDIRLAFGWKVRKPRLSEIAEISFPMFDFYQSLITLTLDDYLNIYANEKFLSLYNQLPAKEKSNITLYSLISKFKDIAKEYVNVLNFFSSYPVVFSDGIFYQINGKDDDGKDVIIGAIITEKQFDDVRDCIRTICGLEEKKEDVPKFANGQSKIGMEIWEKLQKGRKQLEDAKGTDRNFELSNIISAVAVKDNSLSFINIWDLTIYQLMETFARLRDNFYIDISKTHVSVWGDKDNKFDGDIWFKNKNIDN